MSAEAARLNCAMCGMQFIRWRFEKAQQPGTVSVKWWCWCIECDGNGALPPVIIEAASNGQGTT